MNPACKYSIVDFYKDGGVPRLMENLQSMLETDVMTVTAHTLAENIRDHKYLYPATGLVNHTLDDPFGYTGGVAVLRGNLAPDTGITKPGAFDKSLHHFEGEAICFDSEEAAEEAILAGKVRDGHVVVIRYEGPKGGPGMREMYKAMKYLYGRGLSKTTALITDGRFSGTNNGCFVGHISPEAAEGGPSSRRAGWAFTARSPPPAPRALSSNSTTCKTASSASRKSFFREAEAFCLRYR